MGLDQNCVPLTYITILSSCTPHKEAFVVVTSSACFWSGIFIASHIFQSGYVELLFTIHVLVPSCDADTTNSSLPYPTSTGHTALEYNIGIYTNVIYNSKRIYISLAQLN